MNPKTFETKKPTKPFVVKPDSWHRKVIEFVYHARLATIDQLQAIAGLKSREDFKKALKSKLIDHGYLVRPEITRSLYSHAKERPVLQALGDAGARYCQKELDLPIPESVQWTRKNKELKDAKYIAHTVGVAEMKKDFQTRLEGRPGYRLQHTAEVIATSPAATMPDGQRVSFPTSFTWSVAGKFRNQLFTRSTLPDWLFRIERLADHQTLLLMLEWDENTEQLIKEPPDNKTSILQKDLGYADIHRRGMGTRFFGNKRFQRLFVTTGTDNRVDACINLYQQHTADLIPAHRFLYTTAEKFQSADTLYDPIWLDGDRIQRSLLKVG